MKVRHALGALLTLASAGLAFGGDGHDHGATPVGAVANAPQRLPDGSTFLPKPSQRQLDVRTIVAKEAAVAKSVELVGRVIVDPNGAGKVQSTLAGRIEPGSRGLPSLGQTVNKGELLAVVRPTTGVLERANQAGHIAELRSALALAEKRLASLQQLAGTVPRKDIEAAQSAVQSLTDRLAAVGTSLATVESLFAPVAGVISIANVVAGQVVDAREVVFEIIDPARLRIEALAYDALLAGDIATATASVATGSAFAIELIGAGPLLREQALPIHFRMKGTPRAAHDAKPGALWVLAVGQPVKVVVQTRATIKGFPVPAAAVVKNASNRDIVWVHTSAEGFAPKTIRSMPLDGERLTIVDGVQEGDRIVVQGASLVNQIR